MKSFVKVHVDYGVRKDTMFRNAVKSITCFLMALLCVLFCACEGADSKQVTVLISKESISLTVGEETTLFAQASNKKEISWQTSDVTIASVDNGTVKALKAGRVTITASCGSAYAVCEVLIGEFPYVDSPLDGYLLVWCDEFEGTQLDTQKWSYQIGTHDVYHGIVSRTENWGNNELQYYTEDSVTVSDGILTITAQKRDYGGKEYTSGRILTRDLAVFTYGYIEARIKLPVQTGMWPAFWMLPQPTNFSSTNNKYGGWSASGEIDILEAKGRLPYIVGTTLHFKGLNGYKYLYKDTVLTQSIAEWHTYAVLWEEDRIVWIIDGETVFTLTKDRWSLINSESDTAPFDTDFYLLLNLAVGGNYDGGRAPATDFISGEMQVDYVRVFQK